MILYRSNQVREGMINRGEALHLIEAENRPRYVTSRWYLDVVGIEFDDAVRQINAIPKLYVPS